MFDAFEFQQDSLKQALEEHTAALKENTRAVTQLTELLKQKAPSYHHAYFDHLTHVNTQKQEKEFNFHWDNPTAGRNEYKNNPRF